MRTSRIEHRDRAARRAFLGCLLAAGFCLGGCGGERPRSVAKAPAAGESAFFPNSLSSDAAPLGTAVPFAGGAVAGSGPMSRELVTIVRMIRPRVPLLRPGRHRYAAVELTIRNVGSAVYVDSPGKELSLVSSTTGGHTGLVTRPPVRVRGCRRDLSKSVQVAPGGRLNGCVFFLLPPRQRISAVQYQTQDGYGPNLVTWALNRWQIHG